MMISTSFDFIEIVRQFLIWLNKTIAIATEIQKWYLLLTSIERVFVITTIIER